LVAAQHHCDSTDLQQLRGQSFLHQLPGTSRSVHTISKVLAVCKQRHSRRKSLGDSNPSRKSRLWIKPSNSDTLHFMVEFCIKYDAMRNNFLTLFSLNLCSFIRRITTSEAKQWGHATNPPSKYAVFRVFRG
jgi:hypothetical protein